MTNVIREVHSAVIRALRATTSSVPRTNMMKSAPMVGRKVTTERIGQLALMTPSPEEQIPGDQRPHADQHRKRIMVDVAALQGTGAPREPQRVAGKAAVNQQAVDDSTIALLPKGQAE